MMTTRGAPGATDGKRMTTRDKILLAIVAMACAVWAAPADSQRVYRWVDENGVVHFGDAIPPEYSKERHEVLHPRGTRTTVHEEKKPSQSLVRDDRDRALLATYSTVAEIESLRDRRIGYLDAQNAVAEDRLRNLKARQQEFDGNPAMINELATIEQRIREYDAEIARRDGEIGRIRGQFDDDIARFRELKGLPAPEETAAKADR
jgi:hypothetical protein